MNHNYIEDIREPLAFIIDWQVAPYIILASDKCSHTTPPEIQTMVNSGRFQDVLKGPYRPSQLGAANYLDPVNASVALGVRFSIFTDSYVNIYGRIHYLDKNGDIEYTKCIHTKEFTKQVTFEDKNGLPIRSEECEGGVDDALVFIRPKKKSTPFKAAYASVDEFITEIKAKLEPLGTFPPDFNWAEHVVAIDANS